MATFLGTSGNDTIAPGLVSAGVLANPLGSVPLGIFADLLNGGEGDDSLEGGGGGDTLLGAGGNDTLSVGSTTGSADGDEGNDVFIAFGTLGTNPIAGGNGTDVIRQGGALNLTNAIISGVEQLALSGAGAVILRASQLDGFTTVTAAPGATSGAITMSTPTDPALFVDVDVIGLGTLTVTGSVGIDRLVFRTPGSGTPPNITVNAGFGNDYIVTDGGNDSLNGADGNDYLSSVPGTDTISGATGNDTIDFSGGDQVSGGADNDLLTIFTDLGATSFIDGGSGSDTLRAFQAAIIDPGATIQGVEVLALDSLALTMSTAAFTGFTTIAADNGATAGVLSLTGGGSAITAVTQLAQLSVTASGANDSLVFTTATVGATAISVDGGAGNDSLRSDDGADTLHGGVGNDSLEGRGGADVLEGDAGNDLLQVRDGDSAFGGADDDRFELDDDLSSGGVMDGGLGIDILDPQGTRIIAASATITGIEQLALDTSLLTLTATQLGSFQTIVADGATLFGNLRLSAGGTASLQVDAGLPKLMVQGSAVGDQVAFLSTAATVVDVSAGNGDDEVASGAGADTLRGEAGNDTLIGGDGADSLDGGGNDDVLFVGTGDVASGGSGNDAFLVTADLTGPTTIDGGLGFDRFDTFGAVAIGAQVVFTGMEGLALDTGGTALTGLQLSNFQTLVAATEEFWGELTLVGEGAASFAVQELLTLVITGATGNDSLTVTSAASTAITAALGSGNDSMQSGAQGDSLSGGSGNDTLSGAGAGDALTGAGGLDLLIGGSGADSLSGGADADTLVGGQGADRLSGGAGADLFRFDLPADGRDQVADFSGLTGDRIAISAGGFLGGLVAGTPLDAGQLRVGTGNGSSAPTGTGQFVFDTAKAILWWDGDGFGGSGPTAIAKLSGVSSLATTDFVILA